MGQNMRRVPAVKKELEERYILQTRETGIMQTNPAAV